MYAGKYAVQRANRDVEEVPYHDNLLKPEDEPAVAA